MMAAIDRYLALRRGAGFALSNAQYLLRSIAAFAADRRERHIRTATVIDWASRAPSSAQRHTRDETVRQFAQHLHLEDLDTTCRRRITSATAIPVACLASTQSQRSIDWSWLPRSCLQVTPCGRKTYTTLISLLAAIGLRHQRAAWRRNVCTGRHKNFERDVESESASRCPACRDRGLDRPGPHARARHADASDAMAHAETGQCPAERRRRPACNHRCWKPLCSSS